MTIINQPEWLPCRDCGKTGAHTHSGKPTRIATDDLCGDCGGDHDRLDRRDGSCPALNSSGHRIDPEHEPNNPNCLCFQPSCVRPAFNLDALLDEVVASRREALKTMSADDVRDWFADPRPPRCENVQHHGCTSAYAGPDCFDMDDERARR